MWFNINEVNQRMILVPGEEPPRRTCKSKRFIAKIMFLCAVARPRFHPETNECLFDGKIGIWPFVQRVAPQRSSANRARGTVETKILNVDREAYLDKVINDLIPAILVKFPDLESAIKIKQDNARPHIHPDDPYFLNAAANQGLNLEMECQSPNSPDHKDPARQCSPAYSSRRSIFLGCSCQPRPELRDGVPITE